jgi:hypothetical protein
MQRNGDSWGLYLSKWALGILATLITAALLAGAASSIQVQKDVIEMKIHVEHNTESIRDIDATTGSIQRDLLEHMRQTAIQAHGGGGGQ